MNFCIVCKVSSIRVGNPLFPLGDLMGWRKKNMDMKKVGDREKLTATTTFYIYFQNLRNNGLRIFQFLQKLLSASVSKCGNQVSAKRACFSNPAQRCESHRTGVKDILLIRVSSIQLF